MTSADSHIKLVTAIIKPFKLDDVRAALDQMGIIGMTVTEVKGCGRQRGQVEFYRGAEYAVDFLPKVKIEIAVPAYRLFRTLDVIENAARTGRIGDGKIFVSVIENMVGIRTAETNEAAL